MVTNLAINFPCLTIASKYSKESNSPLRTFFTLILFLYSIAIPPPLRPMRGWSMSMYPLGTASFLAATSSGVSQVLTKVTMSACEARTNSRKSADLDLTERILTRLKDRGLNWLHSFTASTDEQLICTRLCWFLELFDNYFNNINMINIVFTIWNHKA